MRTYDVGSADFHVIGAPLASAWRTVTTVQTFLKSNKCGTWESHRIRANAIARRLKGMKQFQATRGRNFLLLNSYYFTSDALGPELLALLMTGPSLFTAADHFFKQSQKQPRQLYNQQAQNQDRPTIQQHSKKHV